MSVDHPAVDTLCPHGPDEARGPDLVYVIDSGCWDDQQGLLFNPDRCDDGAWIRAAENAFVEAKA